MMKHDELASDLAAHLRGGSSRVTWENMQLGPSGSPRPDVYSMEPTYTRLSFEAFEVKVSVADFRSDVTSGKWQAYLKFANSVTFAAPAGLITKDMVPATCGLILRGKSGWRYAKKPVRQVLTDIPWQAWIKLLLDGTERAGAANRLAYFTEWRAREKLAEKFGKDVAQQLADLQGIPGRLEYERKRLEESLQFERDRAAETRKKLQAENDGMRDRCSADVAKLALALGLPADCLLSDLDGRARQLLGMLNDPSNAWRRHPMVELAQGLEDMAKRVREAHAALGMQPQAEEAASA